MSKQYKFIYDQFSADLASSEGYTLLSISQHPTATSGIVLVFERENPALPVGTTYSLTMTLDSDVEPVRDMPVAAELQAAIGRTNVLRDDLLNATTRIEELQQDLDTTRGLIRAYQAGLRLTPEQEMEVEAAGEQMIELAGGGSGRAGQEAGAHIANLLDIIRALTLPTDR